MLTNTSLVQIIKSRTHNSHSHARYHTHIPCDMHGNANVMCQAIADKRFVQHVTTMYVLYPALKISVQIYSVVVLQRTKGKWT